MTNNNWELVKLGDILNFKTGRLDSNAATLNGEYPFFTCSPETLSINSYAFDDEAVLLAGNNANGVFSVKYYIGKFNAYQRTYVITSKDRNLVSIRWLYFRIKHVTAELQKMSVGTATKFLTKKILDNFEIRLPTLIEQESIANILWSLQSQIDINIQINQTLESIAQAIFKSWFIDFDPVRAKIAAKQNGADPELAAMCVISGKSEAELKQMSEEDFAELQATAALFPAELMESELGKVPNGWLPVNIEYFIELIYGKALKKTERIHGVYPVYGSGGLTGWHNKALVKGPGVIIGRKGTIGSIFLENKDFYPIDTTYYVKTKNNCSLLFAYYLLQTLGLEKMNTDAAVPGLNRQNFYHLEVPFYSSDLIEKYTKTIENIISKNLSIKKENEYLIGMRDSLLPKLLSGEVALGDVIDG